MQSNFYDRKGASNHHPTVVPGMDVTEPEHHKQEKSSMPAHDPIVGFLYSISRDPRGEYWPVYVGSNKIGRSEDNTIVLKEGTVSSYHAEILSKPLKKDGRVIASIRDAGSKTGIIINNTDELDYGSHELHNGDKILIGNAYELLFILIDPTVHGLSHANNFLPTESEEKPVKDPFGNSDETGSFYDPANRNAGGTINLDTGASFGSGQTEIF